MNEQKLMQAILDSPEDDAPRLQYAAWLEARGQGERAELIRLQIELARLEEAAAPDADPTAQEDRLYDRVEELLGDYMGAFGAEPPVSRADVLAGWTKRNSRDGRLQMHHSPGCDKCDQTGFKGRAGVHELMVVSRDLRRLIQNGARAEELQAAAMKDGMRTLRQDGIDKVLAGQSTIEEVRATSNA